MKTIEEKAKAYDEALKYARIYYTDGDEDMKIMMKTCFPVLVEESEDEKIRKWCISHFKECINVIKDNDECKEYLSNKVLTWLEKQGEQKPIVTPKFRVGDIITDGKDFPRCTIEEIDEQVYYCDYTNIDIVDADKNWKLVEHKPADKVEPKFKVGDWIVSNGCPNCGNSLMRIVKVGLTDYLCRYCNGQTKYCREFIDKSYHLWIIQDAKDGDVLVADNGLVFIYNGYLEEQQWPFAYGGINIYGRFNICDGLLPFTHQKVVPATKEQRDTLMKEIADAGYIFDLEKKELKRIEQKPAWSDKDDKMFNSALWHVKNSCGNGGKNSGEFEVYYWLKSLKDRVQPQPKYEWSDDDEKIRSSIIDFIRYELNHRAYIGTSGVNSALQIEWLKSLRPQKKQEHIEPSWLDEANNDEELLIAIEALEKAGQHDSALWVKHLADSYPQSHWRPSEEQMEVLLSEVNAWTKGCPKQIALESLYNDLKKLK